VWPFAFPACLLSRLLVLTRLARFELYKVMIIAPLSLGINILLIPRYGSSAAAWVAVLSSFLVDFLVYGLFRDTRFLFGIAFDALRSLFTSPIVSFQESKALFAHKS
jgi:hypothetical protein